MSATAPHVLKVAAIAEFAAGLALLIAPALVAQQLLGEQPAGLALIVARVTGIALIGLGIASWPGPALLGMLTYSAMVALYLATIGLTGVAGPLLWPAVILHVVLTALLGAALAQQRRASA